MGTRDAEHRLSDLIDIARLQRLCDNLTAVCGMAFLVLESDGTALVTAGWQDLCTRFHRRAELTLAGCLEGERRIAARLAEGVPTHGYIAYRCANGLWDIAFPLMIDGRHTATVITGQFFFDDDAIDVEMFHQRAIDLGFDVDAYLAALARVPVLSHEHVDHTIRFVGDLVSMLGEIGLGAASLASEHAALIASEEQYRTLAEDMPVLVYTTKADGEVTYVNDAMAALVDQPHSAVIDAPITALVDPTTAAALTVARDKLASDHPVETYEETRPDANGGEPRQYEWTQRGFFDQNGVLLRVQAAGRDVTERRRTEEALRSSERKYRAVVQQSHDAILLHDANGSILDANPRLHETLGYTTDDLRSMTVADIDGEMAATGSNGRWAKVLGGRHVHYETELRRRDGSLLPVDVSLVPVDLPDGPVILATLRDITARKRTEDEREEWRHLLDYVIQHDQNAVAVFDRDMRYVFVSDRFLDDFNVADRDVIGASHYDVFPDIPEHIREVHQRVLAGAVERADEDPFVRADGSTDWTRWECRPWYDARGSIGGLVLYSEIITARREAAEELRQSREQYQTFINATDDIAFLKDNQLQYVIVNTANADYLGRSVEEIVGHSDDELMSAEGAHGCRASDVQALELGRLVVTTENVGGRVYETRKFPVTLANGSIGVGGYVRDVTEQRRAEEEIRRLASDLEHRVDVRTEQLEATNRELSSFAYSISHDLRSPLRALHGFSEILLEDYGETLDDTGRDYLLRIKGAASHMAELMDGLLQLSRLSREELAIQDVDLSAMAASVVDELRDEAPDRDVTVSIAPGLHVAADPKLLRAVLANLLGNAWKFTSGHDHAAIEVGEKSEQGVRAFYVKDDGAGFDMRYADNLFGAFQRLHTADQFEGTGIGLATVQRIVHRHGGVVWAESEVETGATFWFTLEPTDESHVGGQRGSDAE